MSDNGPARVGWRRWFLGAIIFGGLAAAWQGGVYSVVAALVGGWLEQPPPQVQWGSFSTVDIPTERAVALYPLSAKKRSVEVYVPNDGAHLKYRSEKNEPATELLMGVYGSSSDERTRVVRAYEVLIVGRSQSGRVQVKYRIEQ